MDLSALSSNLPNSPHQRKSYSPPPPPSHSNSHPISPETQLLQAFKSAATSVTLLYKTCATATTNARQEGYCEALSDVLEVIDNESAYTDPTLALQRIREWVIDKRRKERREMSAESEEDEQRHDRQQETPGTAAAPSLQNEDSKTSKHVDDKNTNHNNNNNGNRSNNSNNTNHHHKQTPSDIPTDHPFAFQPPQAIPMYPGEHNVDIPIEAQHGMFQFSTPSQPNLSRQSSYKKQQQQQQQNGQGLGMGAGSKRRFQYNDFFDISGFHGGSFGGGGGADGRGGSNSGHGGAKRGRHV